MSASANAEASGAPPNYSSPSSTTRPVPTPLHLSPAPKPTPAQAIAALFEVMPSQIQRDLAALDEECEMVAASDVEEMVCVTLFESTLILLTVNRARNPWTMTRS
jgi:hypothetical protein